MQEKHVLRSAVALLLAVLCGWVMPAALSAQTAGGGLEGRVADSDGAVLTDVLVTASNTETGLTRSTTTGADGAYHFPTLPVGSYNVRFEHSGFATVNREGVVINVASTRSLDVTLKVASVEETITVADEAPLVNTEPAVGTIVNQDELQNLPLNGRQFANVAVLAPGTTLSYNSDPTKPGQLVVALNGGIGRNVNYIIDGGDNTDDTIGGALQNFNLDGVQEFKIQTMQYKAEYGRSSGGVLSVVTKTGTNTLDGSVYGFFRNDSLNSKTESEKRAGIDKQSLDRKQFGGSIGGPIVKDKVHFFATYERVQRDTNYAVATGGLFPTFDGQTVGLPFTDNLGTAKLTYDINAKQYLQVRYGYQKNDDKYGASPLAAPDSLGTISNKYKSILGSHTAQIGTDKLNELVFQYTSFDNFIGADSTEPLIYFPSGFHMGQNLNTPQATSQRKYQYKDDFSWSTTLGGKRNDFKFGVNYIDEPTLGGDFSTGLSGQFAALNDSLDSPITSITFFGGFFGDETPVHQYSGYVQDDIYLSDRLTLNVGVRYDYWDGFDLDQRSNPIWQVLATQTQFDDAYLRDFQGGKGGVLKNDTNNIAPRLGFTWDITGNGRKLLRGGYGTYYDFPYTNATILFPAAAVQSNYGVAYFVLDPNGIRNSDGTFFKPGDPLPPNQLPGLGSFAPNEVASPTLATPYSDQTSLGYSWQVNSWLGLNFEGVSIRYHDIPFRFRANPGVDANGNGVFEPALGETTRFPQFGNFRLWYGKGRAKYDGVNVEARIRTSNFDLQGFYTYSKTDGNVLAGADEFRITDTGGQADLGGPRRDVSVDPLDPLCDACFGPLFTDAKHRITLSAIYDAPYGIRIGGFLRYHSAFPYTSFVTTDPNGDGFLLDLAPGVSHVNSKRGASFSQLDLRVSKEFTFAGEYSLELIGELFNVFNRTNPAIPNRMGVPSAFAGDPLQGEQRLGQLGVRFRF